MSNPRKTANNRFLKLATLGEVVFHASDAANIWGIANKQTLWQTLSRYAKQGLITRIYKGLYSLKDISDLDPYLVGLKVLHSPAYISCESVLSAYGIINQSPVEIMFVSNKSKRFEVNGKRYRSRKLNDDFLHNTAGINIINGVPMALPERAIADMLYFNPKAHFDAGYSNLIDWNKVHDIAIKVGYNIQTPKIKFK